MADRIGKLIELSDKAVLAVCDLYPPAGRAMPDDCIKAAARALLR